MMHTHHRADLIHAIAASIHHNIAVNIAMFGVYCPCVIAMLRQGCYRRVAIHLGPGFAGASGQGLTQLCRINVAVQRIPYRQRDFLSKSVDAAGRILRRQ